MTLFLHEQTALLFTAHKINLNDRRENKRFSKSEKQIIAINKWLNHTTAQQNIHFVLKNGSFQPAKFLSVSIFWAAKLCPVKLPF